MRAMVVDYWNRGSRGTMTKGSFSPTCLVVSLALATGLAWCTVPAAYAARRSGPVEVALVDTGKTVALGVGQELIVSLPLLHYDDDYWYLARNSGGSLKLISGPDQRRPRNWTPWGYSRRGIPLPPRNRGTVASGLRTELFLQANGARGHQPLSIPLDPGLKSLALSSTGLRVHRSARRPADRRAYYFHTITTSLYSNRFQLTFINLL